MNLYENPSMSLGLGLLAANQPGANFGQVLGRGGLLAMENMRLGQQHAANLAKAQEAREQREAEQARREAQIEYFRQQGGDVGAFGQQFPELAAQRQAQVLLPAPEKPVTPTSLERNLQAAGFTPGTPQYQAEMIKAINKPLSQTTIQPSKQITKEQETVGKFYGEEFTGMQQTARKATAENARLDRLNQLLDQAYTGKGGKTVLAAKKAAKMIGIDVSGIGEAEAAEALANEMALQLRNPAGGAGMPGALSDKDREFLQSMVPGLTTTKEGRKQLIETRKRINQRNIEVARLARNYRRQYGQIDEGFFDQLAEFSEASPLFPEGFGMTGETQGFTGGAPEGVFEWSELPTSKPKRVGTFTGM